MAKNQLGAINTRLLSSLTPTRSISSVVHGDVKRLPPKVRNFVEDKARLCDPDHIHVCDGSEAENDYLFSLMQKQGMVVPLPKYENWYAGCV